MIHVYFKRINLLLLLLLLLLVETVGGHRGREVFSNYDWHTFKELETSKLCVHFLKSIELKLKS